MNKFNFGNFLLENGFSYTNTGTDQFFHIDRAGTEHRFKLNGSVFEHRKPEFKDFSREVQIPKTKATAVKLIKTL